MRPSLTAAARDGRTIVRVGTEEWLRRGPNQRMARHRRATCRQIRSANPKLSPLHGTGASPEPIKPIAFLLFTRKHHLAATLLIVVGEIIKLTLFEQLFDMTKPKLMTFPWFAWCYGKWRAAIEHVRSLPVWHKMLSWYRTVRAWALRWRIN